MKARLVHSLQARTPRIMLLVLLKAGSETTSEVSG